MRQHWLQEMSARKTACVQAETKQRLQGIAARKAARIQAETPEERRSTACSRDSSSKGCSWYKLRLLRIGSRGLKTSAAQVQAEAPKTPG